MIYYISDGLTEYLPTIQQDTDFLTCCQRHATEEACQQALARRLFLPEVRPRKSVPAQAPDLADRRHGVRPLPGAADQVVRGDLPDERRQRRHLSAAAVEDDRRAVANRAPEASVRS